MSIYPCFVFQTSPSGTRHRRRRRLKRGNRNLPVLMPCDLTATPRASHRATASSLLLEEIGGYRKPIEGRTTLSARANARPVPDRQPVRSMPAAVYCGPLT